MHKAIGTNYWLFGIPLLIMAFLISLPQLAIFQTNPSQLAIGITFDFLLTIPFIYFLLIRKKENIPNISMVSVFIIGLILASFILPQEHQGLLTWIKTFAVPVVELAVLGYLVFTAKKVMTAYQKSEHPTVDFYDALGTACTQVLPSRVGRLLATEIAVIYYLLFAKSKEALKENEYTYYKKNGVKTIIWVLLSVVLIETVVMHLLIELWNSTVAWVLTALGLYTCLQIVALIKSMSLRPIVIDAANKTLYLRYGFFAQTTIPFSEIEEMELNKKALPNDKSIIPISPFSLLDNHNIIIKLKNEHTLYKMYAMQSKYQNIAICVDEKEDFFTRMNELLD